MSIDEFEQMKNHTTIGFDILKKVQGEYPHNEFINMGIDIAKYHHEKFDGNGYNQGLKGNQIPLSARIVAICDTYDALTSERSYKKAYSHAKAVMIIESESGKQFDPTIVKIFLAMQATFHAALATKQV